MRVAIRKIAAALATVCCFIYAQAADAFDFDTGNAAVEVVATQSFPIATQEFGVLGSHVPFVLRWTASLSNAWFDSIAPYHPTAVGIYSNLGRRPASESATNRNMNIAMIYASYHVLNSLLPNHNAEWRAILESVGLNPDDNSEDPTTPVGIGNLAGKAVVRVREHDGMNQLGDEAGCKYNCLPYVDYTHYNPVNSPQELDFPSRWQPPIGPAAHIGQFSSQIGVTPQWAITLAFTFKSANEFPLIPPPVNSDPRNFAAYKAQVDEVLAESAALTDYKKIASERFNHKINSIGFMELFETRNLPLAKTIEFIFMSQVALWDASIVIWHNKFHYDSVRPFSAIRLVYGNKEVTAWGGVGKGTVHDLPASQWTSYLPLPDHPEYPSGTTCICASHAQVARRYFKTDNFGYSLAIPKGSSLIEPGITPATDITFGPFATFTQMENECGMSRVWAGAHFRSAVDQSLKFCHQFGDRAFEFVTRKIAGSRQ
jgi:hypothetical protein